MKITLIKKWFTIRPTCIVCGKVCKNKRGLKIHMAKAHG